MTTEELTDKALKAIKEQTIVFVSDVPALCGISRQTWYDKGLDKVDIIKDAIEENRIKIKGALRRKWYDSENGTVQIALYKLIGTDEEVDRLNGSNVKLSGEINTTTSVTFKKFDNAQ